MVGLCEGGNEPSDDDTYLIIQTLGAKISLTLHKGVVAGETREHPDLARLLLILLRIESRCLNHASLC
ncbi:hypothetical protein ANN_23129 [Periplaneta americana]|uniref:Uncharacterized protein n=1 Tax=Periplaneta americana TaxID=6978 RepID=A0ABQ8SLG9_PERAM|nr:hypothetical protein ANN_23129 [Periplaneta americana]